MISDPQIRQLIEGAAALGVTLDDITAAKFVRYAAMLEEANRRFNLTRISPEDVVTLHFLDSLSLASVIRPQPGDRLLDIGTGAGFPGLPLALAFPELTVTLLDGTRKRLEFVSAVIADLAIGNARTVHGRAEEIVRFPEHHANYDLVTARAVAKLPELAKWMLPLTAAGGAAIAYKSQTIEPEIADLRREIGRYSGAIETVTPVKLPFTEIVRKLVVMRKKRVRELKQRA